MQGLKKLEKQIKIGTPQTGHSRLNTARNTNVKELQCINTSISDAKKYLKKSKDRKKYSKKNFGEAETSFDQFKNQFLHQKIKSLMGNIKAILQPAQCY